MVPKLCGRVGWQCFNAKINGDTCSLTSLPLHKDRKGLIWYCYLCVLYALWWQANHCTRPAHSSCLPCEIWCLHIVVMLQPQICIFIFPRISGEKNNSSTQAHIMLIAFHMNTTRVMVLYQTLPLGLKGWRRKTRRYCLYIWNIVHVYISDVSH